ncbi:MAG: TonB-dependent receptor plug domain-containing protein [Candidatus Kryptoniota bacterium]
MIALLILNIALLKTDSVKVFVSPEVTVTATRTAIAPENTMSKVVSIDAKEFSAIGFADLPSILSSIEGLFVKSYGQGQLSTISSLGTGAEETLLIFDGIRLNSVQNGMVDLFLVPLSQISRIEIAQGGSSSLYGSDAIGGVINMYSPNSRTSYANAKLGVGSYGYQEGELGFGKTIGAAEVNMSIHQVRSRNDYKFDYTDGKFTYPMRRTGADFVSNDQLFKIAFPKETGFTSLTLSNTLANRGTPGSVTGPYFVGRAREYDSDLLIALNHVQKIGEFILSATGGGVYEYLKYVDPSSDINSFYKAISPQVSLQLDHQSDYLSFVTGMDAEVDRATSSEMMGIRERRHFGTYLSSIWKLHYPLKTETRISPSLRIDYYSDFGPTLNPKVGINFKPITFLPVYIRASAGTNFRAPTFDDLYYGTVGNPNLKPERSTNYDAGLGITIRKPFYLQVDANLYSIQIRDGIVWLPENSTIWRPQNYQKIISQGVELSLRANYHDLGAISINYTYGNTRDRSDPNSPTYNKQLIYRPLEQLSITSVVSPGPLLLSASICYVGYRYTTAANDAYLSPYTNVNLTLGANVKMSSAEISPQFSIRNLLNENYQVIELQPMALRTYYFNLNVNIK